MSESLTAAVALRRPDVRLPAVAVLAAAEGRRIVRHPLALCALAGVAWALLSGHGTPRDSFEVVVTMPTYFYGVGVYFAANLVASRDRRAGGVELLAPTPVPEPTRVAAQCLGALLPALLTLGMVLATHLWYLDAGYYGAAPVDATPSGWHLLQPAVTVLGAGLLGVMVARWAPHPLAAAAGMLAMVATNLALAAESRGLRPLGTFTDWARWSDSGAWVGLHDGSIRWHLGYLLLLCAMAATGAQLPTARSRVRVLAVGGVLTAAAAVVGWAQL